MLALGGCTMARAPTEMPSAAAAIDVDQVEEELVRRINAKDARGIVALYGTSMRTEFPEAKTGPFFAELLDEVGTIISAEKLPGSDAERGKGRYRLKAERGYLQLELKVLDGKITFLLVTHTPAPIAKNDIPLALPFRGQWSVFWGGDRVEVNIHVPFQEQRRAADLEVLGPTGAAHRGNGKRNEDYYAYGQDVLAAADGTVVAAVDGVPDNVPGSMNEILLLGNVVILQHTDKLFSTYAHLRRGTLRVKVGDKVRQGAVLAQCGNSGNSSEPHLHWQLQDAANVEGSWGIEPWFQNVAVVRQGKRTKMADYTFLKGDLIGDPQ
jgi:murein DD-endopeptidase MepM/ murein hydrolase activator NlpD